jgi:hypothetical protein
MLRAIFVALFAIAVALPPVAGGVAMAAPDADAAHTDCCPPGEPCESHKPKDCGQTAACMLKCFNLSAGFIPIAALAPVDGTPEHARPLTDSVAVLGEHPPLPPPRL